MVPTGVKSQSLHRSPLLPSGHGSDLDIKPTTVDVDIRTKAGNMADSRSNFIQIAKTLALSVPVVSEYSG